MIIVVYPRHTREGFAALFHDFSNRAYHWRDLWSKGVECAQLEESVYFIFARCDLSHQVDRLIIPSPCIKHQDRSIFAEYLRGVVIRGTYDLYLIRNIVVGAFKEKQVQSSLKQATGLVLIISWHAHNVPEVGIIYEGVIVTKEIGKVVKCLECGKIIILKSEEEQNTKVPKTLQATVGSRLSIDDIRKMSDKTTVQAEFVDADDLAVNPDESNTDNYFKSQEIDADDLAVDE